MDQTDHQKGRKYKKHLLDFESPLIAEAAAKLGLTYDNCLKKAKSEFYKIGENAELAKQHYKYHVRKTEEHLQAIYELARELSMTKNTKG